MDDAGQRRRPWLRRPPGPRHPPGQTFTYRVRGKNRGVETAWERLIVRYANETRACFDWLATTPTRRLPGRCAPLRGQFAERGIWQYEVGGGSRVWYVALQDEPEVVVLRASVGHPKETER